MTLYRAGAGLRQLGPVVPHNVAAYIAGAAR